MTRERSKFREFRGRVMGCVVPKIVTSRFDGQNNACNTLMAALLLCADSHSAFTFCVLDDDGRQQRNLAAV